jgi:hypothetical protein
MNFTRKGVAMSSEQELSTKQKLDILTVRAKAQEGCLDDVVHDLKAQEASNINNSGTDAQILYMISSIGVNQTITDLEDILGLTPVEEDVNNI